MTEIRHETLHYNSYVKDINNSVITKYICVRFELFDIVYLLVDTNQDCSNAGNLKINEITSYANTQKRNTFIGVMDHSNTS